MGKFLQEFKEFISRGSVVDLAVGVIIGAAFTSIVSSLVNDIVMPFIGWVIGGRNFTDYKIILAEATGANPESAILYGTFIQNLLNFILVALTIFLLIKGVNKLHRKKEAEPETEAPSDEIILLGEIRDLLKK